MISVRFTDPICARLQQAAAKAGRPLSREVEARIEQSFDREALLKEVEDAIDRGLFLTRSKVHTAAAEISEIARTATRDALLKLRDRS